MCRLLPATWTHDRIDPSHEIVLEPADEVDCLFVVILQGKVEIRGIDGCCLGQRFEIGEQRSCL